MAVKKPTSKAVQMALARFWFTFSEVAASRADKRKAEKMGWESLIKAITGL